MPGEAVAAAPDGQLEVRFRRQGHHARHVAGVGRLDDGDGAPVESAVEHGAGRVIFAVAWSDDVAAQFGPEPRDGDGIALGLRYGHA